VITEYPPGFVSRLDDLLVFHRPKWFLARVPVRVVSPLFVLEQVVDPIQKFTLRISVIDATVQSIRIAAMRKADFHSYCLLAVDLFHGGAQGKKMLVEGVAPIPRRLLTLGRKWHLSLLYLPSLFASHIAEPLVHVPPSSADMESYAALLAGRDALGRHKFLIAMS